MPSADLDKLYRENFSRMVISLARYVGLHDLATAEDIVQETFTEAADKWKNQVPDNPVAWLHRVARNMALNKLRDIKSHPYRDVNEETDSLSYSINQLFEQPAEDDQLAMLFACIHPDFSARNQVIFALRYVAGFRLDQIATILGSPLDTISKTLFRMRETIRKEGIVFTTVAVAPSDQKVNTLIKIVYLMFSEGSRASSGKSVLNLDLCENALSIALEMSKHPSFKRSEVHALLALMLFNISRFETRFDVNGDLVELEFQDRKQWNAEMIRVATHHLTLARDGHSTYHLEALIAYLHATAPSFQATNWKQIASLYENLLAMQDSPFTKLNLAIAYFYADEVLKALHLLDQLGHSPFMQQYHLYHATLGKIYQSRGDIPLATVHLNRAIELAVHDVERRQLKKMLSRLQTSE